MLSTFVLEWLLVIASLIRFRKTLFGQLSSLLLILLATFQLAEYLICTQAPTLIWARLGLVAITLLPPVGLHLLAVISGRLQAVRLSYGLALLFSLLFLLWPGVTNQPTCGGNYVIFHTSYSVAVAYAYYYLGYLLWGLWEALSTYRASSDHQLRNLLTWMMIGYLSFMVPMAVVYLMNPTAREAIPSIMCGFALLLAFILSFKILPLYHRWHELQTAQKKPKRH